MRTIPFLEKQGEELTQRLNALETQVTEIKASLTTSTERRNSAVTSSSNPRVAIFIDEANIYHSGKKLCNPLNYKQLLSYLAGDATVVGSYLYTGVDPRNKRQQKSLDCLKHDGFKVIEKPLVKRWNGSKKANLDVEIAIDMLALQDQYDVAILVSGDGDFTYAVKKLEQNGKRVIVASFRATTSHKLINAAHQYIDLSTVAA